MRGSREIKTRRIRKKDTPAGKNSDGDDGGGKQGLHRNWRDEQLAEFGYELQVESGKEVFHRLPLTLGPTECERLVTFHRGGGYALRNNLISRLAYAAGMNPADEVSLQATDINFETGEAHAHAGRAGRDRYIFIDKETLAMLKAWIEGKRPTDRLFDVTEEEIWQIMQEAAAETDVAGRYEPMGRRFSPLSLRGQFAIHSCDRGMTPYTLTALMGHEFFETTSMYVDASVAAALQCYDILGPLAGGRAETGIGAYGASGRAASLCGRPKLYASADDEIRAEFAGHCIPGYRVGKRLPSAAPTREECRKLMTAYIEGELAFRNNLIIRLLYVTGMRIGEETNLRVADINFENRTLFVRYSKGDKDRYVVVDPETLDMLRTWTEGKRPGDSVFGIGKYAIGLIVERAGTMTGVAQKYAALKLTYSPHSFRHSFATHCFENGMPVDIVMKLMGHEFPKTTLLYVHTTKEFRQEEFRRFSPYGERE